MRVFELSCLLLLCLQHYVVIVKGQGALIAPVGRSVMWAHLGNADYANELKVNKEYMSLNCGGRLVTADNYKTECGPCGDPVNHNDVTEARPNEAPGGKYAIGKIVAIYHEKDNINVTLNIKSTMNKGGAYAFSICKTDSSTLVTHDCFMYPLTWGLTSQAQIPSSDREGIATYNLQLPADLKCEYCVLQWLWLDGTDTCDPPGSSKCGRRVVSNCADIRIIDKQRPIPSDFDWPRYDEYSSILSPPPESSTQVIVTPRPDYPGVTKVPSTSVTILKPDIGGKIPVNKVTDVGNNAVGDTPTVSQSLIDPIIPVAAGTVALATGGLGSGVFLFFGILYLLYESYRQQSMGFRESAFSSSPFVNNPVLGNPYLGPSSSFQYDPSFSGFNNQGIGNIGPTFPGTGVSGFGNTGARFGTIGNSGTSVSTNQYFNSNFQTSGTIGQNVLIPGATISSAQTMGNTGSSFATNRFTGSNRQASGNFGQRVAIPGSAVSPVQGFGSNGGRISTPRVIMGSTFQTTGNSVSLLPASRISGSPLLPQGSRSFSTPPISGSAIQTLGSNVGTNVASGGTFLMTPTIAGINSQRTGNVIGVTTINQNRFSGPNNRFPVVDAPISQSRVLLFPSVRPEFDQVPRTEKVKKVQKPISSSNQEPVKVYVPLRPKTFKEAKCSCHYKGDYYIFIQFCERLVKDDCIKNSDICSC